MTRCKVWIAFLFACQIAFVHGLICHCSDQKECGHQGCSSCEKDWAGPTCQIRKGKLDLQSSKATQSYTKEKHEADFAVDGDETTYSWTQNTTNTTAFVYWTLDLQSSRNIYEVRIIFRQIADDRNTKRRPGFSVAISDENNNDYYTAKMCHRDNSTSGENIGEVSLEDCAGMARYVHIFNFRNEELAQNMTWSTYPNLELAEVAIIGDAVCLDGWYGTQCNQACGQCTGGTCEKNDGTCSGQVNIAAGGVTSQTSDLNYAGYLWTSDKAVDGCDTAAISANFSSDYEKSRCCSCSDGGAGQQTWTVKLTTPSVLSTIVIEGRTDITIQLTGFTVEIQPVGGSPPIQIYDNAATGDTVAKPIRIENLATNFPVLIERVNVMKPQAPLTLCEVKVFSDKWSCNEGWFGTKCELNCSQLCVGGCEKSDGRCSHCPPRRTGTQCESCPQCKDNECHPNGTCKIACADPTMHGDDCDRRCSDSIAGCTECQSVTGFVDCTKCVVGKYIDRCLDCPANCVECVGANNCTVCKTGYTGVDCSNVCSTKNCMECHPDGTCIVCTRGFFISGSMKSCSNCSVANNCTVCKDPFICEECISGYYQENGKCKKCPVNCVECTSEKSCSKCEAGWQGLTCKCGKNCTQDVAKQVSDWCSQENGTCLKGCVAGKYTSHCKTDCPPLDGSCLICDQTDGNCFECVPGRYGKYGHQFNSSCSEMCGQCADGICQIDNGACSGQCNPGYHGAKCSLMCSANCKNNSCEKVTGKCYECKTGFYGAECDIKCYTNCKLDQTNCRQNDGYCDTCVVGFYGDQCDQNCSINCNLGIMGCRKQDGFCDVCNIGFHGNTCSSACKNCMNSCQKTDGRCDECAIGFYGPDCKYKCPENCLNKCSRDTGHCIVCRKMFYGSSCENPCPDNCGEMGVQQNLCNKDTGFCQQCKAGYYGDKCEDRCSDQCTTNFMGLICEQADGRCRDCPVGMYGKFCDLPCAGKCVNPSKRHSVGDCHQMTSECVHGCQEGYHSNLCNMSCNTGCKGQQCDIDTAQCLKGCEEGFKGEYCSEAMPPSSDAGVIIGVVVALVALSVIIAVIVIIMCRRRRAKPKESQDETLMMRRPDVTDRTTLINGSKKDSKDKPKLPKRSKGHSSDNGDLDTNNDDEAAPLVVADTDPSDYYNLSSQISVDFFADYLRNRQNKDEDWYKDEFKKLPSGLLRDAKDACLPSNQGKCRYKQLYPYDLNRVKLEPDGDVTGDFINASYLKGYKQPEAFIAAQGPTDATVKDFWRMIWQKDCGKIVMLTNIVEEMKTKCVCYWPQEAPSATFGIFEVNMTSERVQPNFTIRGLRVTHMSTKEVKDFSLYHYTAWPDRNVPDNPGVILAFREKVMEDKALLDGPILVHCSAGIGRTGTFIALDYLIRQAHAEKTIDVFRTVTDMRYQRSNFVQTDIQYEFLHNAILEALTVNESEIPAADFNQFYQSLLANDKEQMKLQYQAMNEMSPVLDEDCFAASQTQDNIHKNRYPAILPPDMSRAYLSTPVKGGNDYINAVFLPTCMNKTGFIITQMPLPHTVTDFWRLVYDQHVHNIVMMNNVDDDDDTIGEYWPSEDSTYGPFRVQLLSCENPCPDFSIMNMLLTYKSLSRESKMQVKLFRLESWPDDETLPATTQSLTSMYSQLAIAPRDSQTEAVIVHCMNGAERSGLYCAIAAVLDRLNAEQKVNIPHTVQQLRGRRPELIHTLEQFEFVYRTVAEYIESMQEYANLQF
ncbi:uncharacterized protein LOC127862660 isoform X2 [Dreissena polymorpha]|uniref:uncharacterized protein LOC127862660 isoform X2 n=1 Tax=Dreissena polymorpha TaxID=45954 RepID=UPI00226422B0|nr:uncharacterized protein LOC127862660 isoform X2 [Dreissena polymorpha]